MEGTRILPSNCDIQAPAASLAEPVAAELPLKVIVPRRGWIGLDLRGLWRQRDLLYIFAWRDVKVRYKQTVLGILWAVLQPLTKMLLFTLIFGRLARIDSEGYPYALFVFAGLLPWEFFAESLQRSSLSIIEQERLVTKANFPRLLIPMGAMGACLIDLAISFVILFILVACYPGAHFHWGMLALVPLTLLTMVAALGVGAFISALNVAYRDFRYVLPFLIQVGFFVTPVIYPLSAVPERWQWLASLNPMAGIVDAYRSAILGKPFVWGNLAISAVATVVALLVGLKYFRRMERLFADII